MGKKMKKQKTTAADLPDEILRREILTRLPIKSAVRFKCVSKSWLSLFSDPQFVKQHHTHNATQNPIDYDCLIADKGTKLVILSRYKETKLLAIDTMSFLIGSINGIVCLCRGNKFILWNPAIHQSKEFTLPFSCSSHELRLGNNVGLGFDAFNDHFKLVVLLLDIKAVVVYCSGSDSWNGGYVYDYVIPEGGFEKSNSTVIVKGCPYWTYSKYTYKKEVYAHGEFSYLTAAYLCVLKFHVETDTFRLSPEFYFDASLYEGGYEFRHQFVEMNDCLTLIAHNRHSIGCVLDVYSLDEEVDGCGVWNKMYTLGMFDFYTRGWYVALSQDFKYNDGEILYHDNGMFYCLDHERDENKRLLGTTSANYEIRCFRYTPTLFFIQGMKSVHLTTQSRTRGCFRTPRRLINSLRD